MQEYQKCLQKIAILNKYYNKTIYRYKAVFKENTALYVYKNKLELNKVDENAVKQGFFVFISPSQSANPFRINL